MKLVVTGGGTGGHVFPALETALAARDAGWEVAYLGSKRGQESRACAQSKIKFIGFASEPIYKIATPAGIRGLMNMASSSLAARRTLLSIAPDVIFTTGGYSSAPVVAAARKLRIPYVIHEQNGVPGRTNKLLGRTAFAVATVFHAAQEHFRGSRVVRTGMPVRSEFRNGAQGSFSFGLRPRTERPLILAMGGSQGAAAINEVALATAVRMARASLDWLHIAGVSHYEAILETRKKMAIENEYEIRSYLEAGEMASAVFSCALAVSRSGAGSLSELAAFRKPSVLIPFPHAYGNHQLANAKEFESIGAAQVIDQSDLTPASLESRILLYLNEPSLSEKAANALAEWDVPDSIPRIMQLIQEARGGVR